MTTQTRILSFTDEFVHVKVGVAFRRGKGVDWLPEPKREFSKAVLPGLKQKQYLHFLEIDEGDLR